MFYFYYPPFCIVYDLKKSTFNETLRKTRKLLTLIIHGMGVPLYIQKISLKIFCKIWNFDPDQDQNFQEEETMSNHNFCACGQTNGCEYNK